MQRGQPDQTIYTFELPDGRTMSYPDDEMWTRDYREADDYAREHGYQLIENSYEFEDSSLLADYVPPEECAHCGLPIEQEDTGIWQDPDYEEADDRHYCDPSPDHQHHPGT